MGTTTLSSSSSLSIHLLHQLRRPPSQPPSPSTPSPLLSLFLNPHFGPTAKLNALSSPRSPPKSAVGFRALISTPPSLSSFSYLRRSRPVSSSSSVAAFTQTPSLHPEVSTDVVPQGEIFGEEDGEDGDKGSELLEEEEEEDRQEVPEPAHRQPTAAGKVPDLSVKEKKELASYAHSLGKKLKCQLVGKSGVTDNVAASFIETLEANELLKIKIHRTCPGELDEVVKQLELLTGSVVVGQIGRTIIIYRPSITKLKAEDKKLQARRVFVRKGADPNRLLLKKGQPTRLAGHSRRASTRV